MKKKTNDASGNIARGTAVIIIAMIIVFGAVFAWMYSMDMLFLPSFIEDFLGEDEDDLPWDLGSLSTLVKNGKDESGEVVTFDITYENLRAALLGAQREDGIYISADVSYYTDSDSYTRRIEYYRDKDRFRVELYAIAPSANGAASIPQTLKVSNGEQICFVDKATGESSTLPYDKAILPENEAGIPSVDAVLDALAEFPENEGGAYSSGITDTSLKLVRTDFGNVYYVAFTYSDIGLVEEYYISLLHHAVVYMTSTQNGSTVYSYSAISVSDDADTFAADELYDISKAAKQ